MRMRSKKTSTPKKTAGRPVEIKDGRKVTLYLGVEHYTHAKSKNSTMSKYIRSLIERDIMQEQRVAQVTTL